MTVREPPVIATWLLKRLVTCRRKESLFGDLFEEYQTGRTAGWYWRETAAALLVSAQRQGRLLFSRCAAQVILVLIAQSALLLGAAALASEHPQVCWASPVLQKDSTIVTICVGVTELAIALMLWIGSQWRPVFQAQRATLIRLSISAFAAVGLSAGALTWASTSSCALAPLPHARASPTTFCTQGSNRIADGRHVIESAECRSP